MRAFPQDDSKPIYPTSAENELEEREEAPGEPAAPARHGALVLRDSLPSKVGPGGTPRDAPHQYEPWNYPVGLYGLAPSNGLSKAAPAVAYKACAAGVDGESPSFIDDDATSCGGTSLAEFTDEGEDEDRLATLEDFADEEFEKIDTLVRDKVCEFQWESEVEQALREGKIGRAHV